MLHAALDGSRRENEGFLFVCWFVCQRYRTLTFWIAMESGGQDERTTLGYAVLYQGRILARAKHPSVRGGTDRFGRPRSAPGRRSLLGTELLHPQLQRLLVVALAREVLPVQLPAVDERHQPAGAAVHVHLPHRHLDDLVGIGHKVHTAHGRRAQRRVIRVGAFRGLDARRHPVGAVLGRRSYRWQLDERKLALLRRDVHTVCGEWFWAGGAACHCR